MANVYTIKREGKAKILPIVIPCRNHPVESTAWYISGGYCYFRTM